MLASPAVHLGAAPGGAVFAADASGAWPPAQQRPAHPPTALPQQPAAEQPQQYAIGGELLSGSPPTAASDEMPLIVLGLNPAEAAYWLGGGSLPWWAGAGVPAPAALSAACLPPAAAPAPASAGQGSTMVPLGALGGTPASSCGAGAPAPGPAPQRGPTPLPPTSDVAPPRQPSPVTTLEGGSATTSTATVQPGAHGVPRMGSALCLQQGVPRVGSAPSLQQQGPRAGSACSGEADPAASAPAFAPTSGGPTTSGAGVCREGSSSDLADLPMPTTAEPLPPRYAVPHADYLTPPALRKGRGGRQPSADPRMDPRIDPKKARRILANRLSAAKSKLKRKNQTQALEQRVEMLRLQRGRLAGELCAADGACAAEEAARAGLLRELAMLEGAALAVPAYAPPRLA